MATSPKETQSQFKIGLLALGMDVFLNVCQYWSYQDLFSISATSKEFYQLCCNPMIYKDEELNINIFMLPYLLNNPKYFDKLLSRFCQCRALSFTTEGSRDEYDDSYFARIYGTSDWEDKVSQLIYNYINRDQDSLNLWKNILSNIKELYFEQRGYIILHALNNCLLKKADNVSSAITRHEDFCFENNTYISSDRIDNNDCQSIFSCCDKLEKLIIDGGYGYYDSTNILDEFLIQFSRLFCLSDTKCKNVNNDNNININTNINMGSGYLPNFKRIVVQHMLILCGNHFSVFKNRSCHIYTQLDLKCGSTYYTIPNFAMFKIIFHSNLKALRICQDTDFLGIHRYKSKPGWTLNKEWDDVVIMANDDNSYSDTDDTKSNQEMNEYDSNINITNIRIFSNDKEMKPIDYVCAVEELIWNIALNDSNISDYNTLTRDESSNADNYFYLFKNEYYLRLFGFSSYLKRLLWTIHIEYDSFKKSHEIIDIISNTLLKTFINLEELIIDYQFDLSKFERHKMQNLIAKKSVSLTDNSNDNNNNNNNDNNGDDEDVSDKNWMSQHSWYIKDMINMISVIFDCNNKNNNISKLRLFEWNVQNWHFKCPNPIKMETLFNVMNKFEILKKLSPIHAHFIDNIKYTMYDADEEGTQCTISNVVFVREKQSLNNDYQQRYQSWLFQD